MAILMALSVPFGYADNGDVKTTGTVHQDGDWHHAQREHRTAQILNLSEDQQKQLKDIHQKQKDAMKSIFEQMKSNRNAFEAEIIKTAPDMSKVNSIQIQIKGLLSQIADNHLNKLLEIKKIMTPEQFAGYMALEKEEDIMKHEGQGKFNHKDGFGKDGNGHQRWEDKQEQGDND